METLRVWGGRSRRGETHLSMPACRELGYVVAGMEWAGITQIERTNFSEKIEKQTVGGKVPEIKSWGTTSRLKT